MAAEHGLVCEMIAPFSPLVCLGALPGPISGQMDCPKCGFGLDAEPAECTRCGVVIAKFLRSHQESLESAVEPAPLLHATHAAASASEDESAAHSERIARAVALPLALLFAWLAVRGSPGAV